MLIYDILTKISKTTSKTEKENILQENKDNELLKQVLEATYNPFKNYWIKIIPNVNPGRLSFDKNSNLLFILLENLSARKITGDDARKEFEFILSQYDEHGQDIVKRIINRDLTCGFNESTINKVFPNLIPTFNVALANKYSDVKDKINIFDGKWYVSRKMDGVRVITIKSDNDIKFYSRNGKEFSTLGKLKSELQTYLKHYKEIVLDGEVCLLNNGQDDFQGIMKQITRKDHTIQNVRYWLFDMIEYDDFIKKESTDIFSNRLKNLQKLFKDNKSDNIRVLNQEICTPESFERFSEMATKNNWEGTMLRYNTIYKGKRSNDLLKVKKFNDAEYKVKNAIFGTMTFADKNKGQIAEKTLCAVEIEHKGYIVKVGSGFTREERKEFYNNPQGIIGKTITVTYFEETKNQDGGISLRFPTVKYIHGNKRMV